MEDNDLDQDLDVNLSSQDEAVTSDEVETVETDVESATTEDTGEEGNDRKEDSTPKGVKKRFNKLTRERETALQEAQYWKDLALEKLQGSKSFQEAQQTALGNAQQVSAKPSLADYEYDMDAYTDALTDWKVDQKLEAKLAQQAARSKQAEYASKFDQRGAEFATQVPDYEESVREAFAGRPLDRDSAEVIQDSEFGPQIAYYLSQNDEVLDQLRRMPVARRLVEIGRIETRLSSKANGGNAAGTNKQSVKRPPEPIRPVKGASTTASKRVEDMTFAEFERYEKEQWAKKHK